MDEPRAEEPQWPAEEEVLTADGVREALDVALQKIEAWKRARLPHPGE